MPQDDNRPPSQGAVDLFKFVTGLSQNELADIGRQVYPEEDASRNQQSHRLAARLMTDRYGAIPAQLAGLGNELYERAMVGNWQGDELGDLGANLRGSMDAYANDLNTPWGLARIVQQYWGGNK